jgi:acetyl esterase/lipase
MQRGMTMDSLHLVDMELRPLLDAWPAVTVTADNLLDIRARKLPLPDAELPGITLERRLVAGPRGAPDIMLHIYAPEGATGPLPCIYHIHGGGFVSGAAGDLEPLHKALVSELGCALISVDYRLAPETVFPGAIEDCYAGLAYVFANSGQLGEDPARIGLMGESAGGGLAAALALLVRDRQEYTLAFQHLVYPMIDDQTCTVDPHPFTGEFVWTRPSNRFGWEALLGQEPGGKHVSPYAAAARAENLAGLPRTFIAVGALDLFLEEDMEFARRLMRAGVATELRVWPGGFHGFDMMPDAAISVAAQNTRKAALARFLARRP